MTILLGIDPGSRITGFGVIHMNVANRAMSYIASGCIRTIKENTMAARLGVIYDGISQIIEAHKPHEVAIEQVFLKQNVMSALKLGHARGAAMACCAKYCLDVAEYSPRSIKQAVVGFGGAEKAQVQKMVVELLRLGKAPSVDAADALAVAVCHGFHHSRSMFR